MSVDELGLVTRPETAEEAMFEVYRILAALPIAERNRARRLIRNRLIHPELGGHPEAAPPPPLPSTGDCYAAREPRLCLVCNTARGAHDIDGLRNDCDGYQPTP